MRDPEEALAAARAAAAAGNGTGEDLAAAVSLDDPEAVSKRLMQWAIIEPDRARVYSTRPYGLAITWLKRALVRLLRQYLDQLSAQQSRFNAQLAAQVLRLEERVSELERTAGGRHADPPADSHT